MIRAAGILILDTTGKALFLKRGPGGDYPGAWCLPGGCLEDGEDAIDAAIRETNEESGFGANKSKLTLWTRSVSSRAPMPTVAPPVNVEATGGTITEQLQANMAAAISPPAPVIVTDNEVDFSTFVLTNTKQFVPVLGPIEAPEHVGYAWAPLDQPPQPLHPGVQIAIDRFSLDELGVAQAMASGRLTSPQRYENLWLFEMRITGTGVSYRLGLKEFVNRDESHYLNDHFLARCNGLPVILEHPKGILLNSKEFSKRVVGSIMLPYIKGTEVWGIAKIFDDETAALMQEHQLSTSPAVNWRNPDANNKVELEDGNKLLFEGKPSLLDHLAICPLGVWDKGGKPTGVTSIEASRGDSVMKVTLKRIEGETDEGYAARVAEAQSQIDQARGDAAILQTGKDNDNKVLADVLGGIKAMTAAVESVTGDIKSLKSRMDAAEDEKKGDKKADARKRADAFKFGARGDAEDDDKFKGRMDAEEETLRGDMEEAGEDKDKAKADAKARRDAFEKECAKGDADDDDGDDAKGDKGKRGDARGDAADTVIAELRARVETLQASIPKQPSDEEYGKFATVQARADAIMMGFGASASRPLQGETLDAYRRRLLNPIQLHHPDWAKANLMVAAADSAMLDLAEKQIYEAAAVVSRSPANVPVGTLREIPGRTRAGHVMSEFAGESKVWMSRFMPTGRAVQKINLNKGGQART